MNARLIGNEDLHAYVDGQLDPARRAEVADFIAQNAEAAARVASYARLNELLHRRLDHTLLEPIPHGMLQARWRATVSPRRLALVTGLLAMGILGGWLAHGELTRPNAVERAVAIVPIARQAAVAHAVYAAEVRHPVEVRADAEAHLTRWLSNRMGREIKVPRLEAMGYRLMGGRLLPGTADGLAAQFMYESANGMRVTLFIRTTSRDQGETAFRFTVERDEVGVVYWLGRTVGYAISAKLPRGELLRVAHEIYEQLDA